MATEKSSAPGGRAWRMLRLALLCARRGSQRIVADIRRALRHLRAERSCHSYSLRYYGEHELSFDDDTSPFQFKKPHRHHRLFFPCIDPPLVSFDDDEGYNGAGSSVQVEEEYATNGDIGDGGENNHQGGEENCIDSKAEEFISRFYEDMKLQRQVSFLRYKEMLC